MRWLRVCIWGSIDLSWWPPPYRSRSSAWSRGGRWGWAAAARPAAAGAAARRGSAGSRLPSCRPYLEHIIDINIEQVSPRIPNQENMMTATTTIMIMIITIKIMMLMLHIGGNRRADYISSVSKNYTKDQHWKIKIP